MQQSQSASLLPLLCGSTVPRTRWGLNALGLILPSPYLHSIRIVLLLVAAFSFTAIQSCSACGHKREIQLSVLDEPHTCRKSCNEVLRLRNQQHTMSEPIPTDAKWGYDSIDHYRLTADIINDYLQRKWGRYNFYIEVS